MKKKVIIVSHNMRLGGIEKSLLGLLLSFDYEKYDVDLFLFNPTGELLQFLPDKVNLMPENKYYSCITASVTELLRRKKIGVVAAKIISHIKKRRYNKKNTGPNDVAVNYLYNYVNNFAPEITDKNYDIAISFSDVHYATIDKINADKKLCWIHTDYSVINQDKRLCFRMWDSYDNIIAVSENSKKAFLTVYPTLSDKLVTIENILPKEYVYKESEKENAAFDKDCVNILSIGRFCEAKNFDNVPDICKKIIAEGLKIKWYIIGFGGDEDLIRRKTEEAGMQDNVIILGKKDNPYPYIKACDLYVQPSRYEGKSVTVREAQMLGKPVVITDYPTSASQLENGVDGIIVPLENGECAKAIANLIKNPERMKMLSENCKKRDYSNSSEIEKIYSLIED